MADIPATVAAVLTITPDNGADLQALYELALARIGQDGTVTKDDQAGHVVVEATQPSVFL
ncbi:hypothetical protein [Sphingomonas sp.]|jgi:hypothetical protein|uniref:hypothetical protein n=1 Tax=Sphingomonas sp. TaxID=28214 RepID=UPI003562FAC5